MDTNDTFWMVKGEGPTSKIHQNENDAKAEARRLAVANPGVRFYVLQAQKAFVTNQVVEIDLDMIPF